MSNTFDLEQAIENCIAGTSMIVFIENKSCEIQKENGKMITFDEMMSNLYSLGLIHDGENLTLNPLTYELGELQDGESNTIAIVYNNICAS